VGGKTAAKWITRYGSLAAILDSTSLEPKVSEKIEASRHLIEQNRQMVALDLDLPLPLPVSEMKVSPRYPELISALKKCEFRSLTAEVEREARGIGGASPTGVPDTRVPEAGHHGAGVHVREQRGGGSGEDLAEMPPVHGIQLPSPIQGELFR
jgi:DNA polymerase-1